MSSLTKLAENKAGQDLHDFQDEKQDEPRLTKEAGVVERELVEALRDIAEVISIVVVDFPLRHDRARLIHAQQLIGDVAFAHDLAGGYGLYAAFGAPDEAGEDFA